MEKRGNIITNAVRMKSERRIPALKHEPGLLQTVPIGTQRQNGLEIRIPRKAELLLEKSLERKQDGFRRPVLAMPLLMVIYLLANGLPFLDKGLGIGRLQQRTQKEQGKEKYRHQHRTFLAAEARFPARTGNISATSPQTIHPPRRRFLKTSTRTPAPGVFPCLHLLAFFSGHGLLILSVLRCATILGFALVSQKETTQNSPHPIKREITKKIHMSFEPKQRNRNGIRFHTLLGVSQSYLRDSTLVIFRPVKFTAVEKQGLEFNQSERNPNTIEG